MVDQHKRVLSKEDRDFIRKHNDDMTVREVADILNVDYNTVMYYRKSRGLIKSKETRVRLLRKSLNK